jgi:hypothetical protein
MFYLCTAEATDLTTIFGTPDVFLPQESQPPKYPGIHTILIGQRPDCSGYLLLSDMLVPEFTIQTSVPSGYDFIFRQSWGLTITEETLHRVISTLRQEAYPPMADYLDAIVKEDQVQLQNYLDSCREIKLKYPKFSW